MAKKLNRLDHLVEMLVICVQEKMRVLFLVRNGKKIKLDVKIDERDENLLPFDSSKLLVRIFGLPHH